MSAGCQRICLESFSFTACSCCSQKMRLKELSSGLLLPKDASERAFIRVSLSDLIRSMILQKSLCIPFSNLTPSFSADFHIFLVSFLSTATERAFKVLNRFFLSGVLRYRIFARLVVEVCLSWRLLFSCYPAVICFSKSVSIVDTMPAFCCVYDNLTVEQY